MERLLRGDGEGRLQSRRAAFSRRGPTTLDHAIGVDVPSGVVKVIEGELELVENDGLAVVLGLPLVQRLGEAEEQVG